MPSSGVIGGRGVSGRGGRRGRRGRGSSRGREGRGSSQSLGLNPQEQASGSCDVGSTAINVLRGQGRGQRRGQGRGMVEKATDVLGQIRAQRQITKSHVAALSADERKELMARKRTAQLHRILLPDAPPRKRRAPRASPDREPCDFFDPDPVLVADPLPVAEPEQIVFEPEPTPEPEALPVLQLMEYVPDPTNDDIVIEITPDVLNIVENDPEEVTDMFVSAPVNSIGTSHVASEVAEELEEWLDPDSGDEDLDVDQTESIHLPLLTPRTASQQPAIYAELAPERLLLLRQEEQASNQVLRELVTNDDYLDFTWKKERQTFTGKRETFTGPSGPTFPVTDRTSLVDIFYKMIDSDMTDLMVTETNRYADQILTRLQLDPSSKKKSRAFRWKPTDRDEMIAFLAVIVLQGLYPKVKEEHYFSFDGFGTTPYFGCIMSYNRYHLLKMMQHFIDNETTEDMTKLNKIRPVINHFNDKFASLYLPSQEIAIDESMLKYHGRLSFTQKIDTKAAGVGVKTYELCESVTGYLWKFRVYTGKDGPNRRTETQIGTLDTQIGTLDTQIGTLDIQTDEPVNRQDRPEDRQDRPDQADVDSGSRTVRPENVTAKIVYDLLEPLLHRGHTLIMDNFYNSPLLARCLKRDGQTDVYGTLRVNREFVPETMKDPTKIEMRPGEAVATYTSDLSLMIWRDSNFVSMISTYHPLQVGTSDKYNRLTYKPRIVLDYNKSMGGVDRKDQFLASQPLERQKNKVWYKKLFRRLFNAAIFNCFVIFTSNQTNKVSHRQFRIVLAEDLIKIHRGIDLTTEPRLLRRNTVTARPTSTLSKVKPHQRPFVAGEHFPASSGSKHTRCWLCARNKVTKRTSFKRLECNVNLCILVCFREYHKP